MLSVRHYLGTVLTLGFVTLGMATADVTTETAVVELGAPAGAYAPGDSAALQGVLDAPGLSGAVDATFELVPEAKMEPASMRTAPASSAFESRGFEAWDMKNGTIVPEPATALLMGAGLAALAVYRGMRGKVTTD
ncbi:MAG: PEP-CTERM sorting domain-containing protein [Candidatus Hydrogenedentes bacterium]|nr:PEP-CTERM sorting domain-containing protein [Candidatus Hydrogenedentota bacterium]